MACSHIDTGSSSSPMIPSFVAKLRDVVGLYVDPPAHAIVLSVDEKSQIQALDRTQPGLPLKKGRLDTMTHDYKRHGTTTLFAALNVLDGTVIGRNMQRHRHQELIRFLNTIEAEVPVGKIVHVILDNYAAHKHPKVRAWLDRHPRFVFHFTPTSCSWLNAVMQTPLMDAAFGYIVKNFRYRTEFAISEVVASRDLGSVDEVPHPKTDGCNEYEADVAVGGLSYRVASLRLCLSFEKHRSTRFRSA